MSSPLRIRIATVLSDAITDEVVSVRYGAGGEAQIIINCFPLADAVLEALRTADPDEVKDAHP